MQEMAKQTQMKPSVLIPSGKELSWDDLWNHPAFDQAFHSSLAPLKTYLEISKNTESPRQYHIWCLIFLVAAIASNHTWLEHGVGGKIKLNMGVVLAGRAAIRKSSAINFMQRFADGVNLNIGPGDTGGARHGIMTAMQRRWQDGNKDSEDILIESLEDLAAADFGDIASKIKSPAARPSSIVFLAKELGRLLTSPTRELLDFFADGLDGEPIHYQTKTGSIRIPNPLINLLGATTPGSLPYILPRDAFDHGLLSRLIFVYAPKAEASVPIPPAISEREIHLRLDLNERLQAIERDAAGPIGFSDSARDEYVRLYDYSVSNLEFKLNAYAGRRSIHLAKLAAVIALLRNEAPYVIEKEDVGLAHCILVLIEHEMDGAYAGLDRSQDSRAYASIRECIESMPGKQVERGSLYGHLMRAGFADEEVPKIFERLIKSGRLVSNIDKYSIAAGLGAEKLSLYLNRWLR